MRKLRYLTALLLLPLCLCACGAQNAKPTEMTDITLGEVAHSIFYAPQYYALAEGYFADEGLNVELVNLNGADKVMTALVSGEIEIGLMGPEASIYVANQKSADYAVNFAQLTKRDGSFLVGREPIDNFSFSDLRGEVLGGRLGGVPEMTLDRAVFRRNPIHRLQLQQQIFSRTPRNYPVIHQCHLQSPNRHAKHSLRGNRRRYPTIFPRYGVRRYHHRYQPLPSH